MQMPIVKRYLMCIDKTRIEYNKNNKHSNKSEVSVSKEILKDKDTNAENLFAFFS